MSHAWKRIVCPNGGHSDHIRYEGYTPMQWAGETRMFTMTWAAGWWYQCVIHDEQLFVLDVEDVA